MDLGDSEGDSDGWCYTKSLWCGFSERRVDVCYSGRDSIQLCKTERRRTTLEGSELGMLEGDSEGSDDGCGAAAE